MLKIDSEDKKDFVKTHFRLDSWDEDFYHIDNLRFVAVAEKKIFLGFGPKFSPESEIISVNIKNFFPNIPE